MASQSTPGWRRLLVREFLSRLVDFARARTSLEQVEPFSRSDAMLTRPQELTVQYAILCYDSEAVVGGWSKEKDDAVMASSLAVKDELAARGKMGPTLRLMPTTTATTIRAGTTPVVLDGPFAETKEQLLGFYIVDCENLDEAIEVAKRFLHGSGSLEIRPIMALFNTASTNSPSPAGAGEG